MSDTNRPTGFCHEEANARVEGKTNDLKDEVEEMQDQTKAERAVGAIGNALGGLVISLGLKFR